MTNVVIETTVNAPAEVCFDLIRDPRIHAAAIMAETNDPGVVAPESGFRLGQAVVFESTILGRRRRMTVKVTEFDQPRRLVDEMTDGSFRSFKHIHEFENLAYGTLLRDTVIWTLPLGIVGRVVDELLLKRHMRKLIRDRNARLKAIAEALA